MERAPPLTLEDVARVYHEIAEKTGAQPKVTHVIRQLNRGSNSTIIKFYRQIVDAEATSPVAESNPALSSALLAIDRQLEAKYREEMDAIVAQADERIEAAEEKAAQALEDRDKAQSAEQEALDKVAETQAAIQDEKERSNQAARAMKAEAEARRKAENQTRLALVEKESATERAMTAESSLEEARRERDSLRETVEKLAATTNSVASASEIQGKQIQDLSRTMENFTARLESLDKTTERTIEGLKGSVDNTLSQALEAITSRMDTLERDIRDCVDRIEPHIEDQLDRSHKSILGYLSRQMGDIRTLINTLPETVFTESELSGTDAKSDL